MMRWLVTLAGAAADLDRLVELPDGSDWEIVRHEKHGAVLCGKRFEALDDYETVGEVAEALLADINRTATFLLQGGFQGVRRAHTVEQREEREHVIMSADTGIYALTGFAANLTWTKRAPDGSVIEISEDREREQLTENYAKLVPLLEANRHLAAALDYIQDGDDWDSSYKAFEAIRDSIGGRAALLKTRWCSKRALSRFTQSAQPDRHHAWPEVEERMTEAEGRAFVRGLLGKLIAHLDS